MNKKAEGEASVVLGFVALVVIFILALGSFYVISAGERGIILTWGKPSDIPASEGLHFKYPVAQNVVKMDIKTQKYEAAASAASKDLQVVSTNIAVNYHLVAERTPILYQEIGIAYQDRIIQPAVQEVVKAATAKFTAEELITRRAEVKEDIKALLKERLQGRDIIVEDISITDFDFSESFNAAIESKVTAEQNALQAKNKLSQIEYEAKQTITKAEAEAESIRIQSLALRENKDILQLRAIEKWDGILPKVTAGATPFIDITAF